MNFYFNSFSPASGESKVIVIVIVITFPPRLCYQPDKAHGSALEWAAPVMVINHPSSKKDSYSVAKVDISRYLCDYKI